MRGLRQTVLAAFFAAALSVAGAPAHAGGAIAFVGTANIDCFGCGSSPGTASLCVEGVTTAGGFAVCVYPRPGRFVPNVTAAYTAVEDNDPATCVISGTATGSTTGAVAVSFNWTRVGATAVILTNGDINGAGVAAFVVTSPAGIPCRSAVTAQVVGTLVGA